MFEQKVYPVYKCGPDTELKTIKNREVDDGYGGYITHDVVEWVPYRSEAYFLHDGEEWNPDVYYPLTPSGKFNERFAIMYQVILRNLVQVGSFNGKEFDCEIPHRYTSAQELKELDVFVLKEDYTYRKNIWKDSETITVPKGEKLIVEELEEVGLPIPELFVSALESPGKRYRIYGDKKVEVVGHIEIIRKFVEI